MALTRVRVRTAVFLASFDASYIQANPKIEEKVNTMIKWQQYQFKKIYLDEDIFDLKNKEIKVGYLNINGLLDGNHIEYFDADKNLKNLDFIVLSETKLASFVQTDYIKSRITNWTLLGRYDSMDNIQHMGLLLMSSKGTLNQIVNISHHSIVDEGSLQIQGLKVRLASNTSVGAIYCRRTPTTNDIQKINEVFGDCDILMGDFNLSHRIDNHQKKLKKLCDYGKQSTLKEITRSISNNQLDYVLVKTELIDKCYSTSFYNFISDHKAVALRMGLEDNNLLENTKEKLYFDKESHLKAKRDQEMETEKDIKDSSSEGDVESLASDDSYSIVSSPDQSTSTVDQYKRRFANDDG